MCSVQLSTVLKKLCGKCEFPLKNVPARDYIDDGDYTGMMKMIMIMMRSMRKVNYECDIWYDDDNVDGRLILMALLLIGIYWYNEDDNDGGVVDSNNDDDDHITNRYTLMIITI